MGRRFAEIAASRCINKPPLGRDEASRATVRSKGGHVVLLRSFFSDLRSRNKEVCPATVETNKVDTKEACSTRHKKSVSFASVEIRNYSVIIGDHPCCTQGCPLSLDWDYVSSDAQSLDEYESTRYPRIPREDLRTSDDERRQILAAVNISECEMRRAERRLNRSRSCSAKLCERVSGTFFSAKIE
jgi:hypothetical protein